MTNRSKTPALGTQAIHAGSTHDKKQNGEAFRAGPEFASTYHLSGDVDHNVKQYGRFGQSTWTVLEEAIGQLEGGNTLVFPSGMSAAACVLTSLVEPGDTILLPSDGYAPVRYYAQRYLERFGIVVKTIATNQIDSADFSGIKLALLETPSNPMLDTFDIALAAEKLRASGGILAVDNTTLSFLGQQPLALGADIVICADTKAVNGHSDVVFGHVATQNDALLVAMQEWRKFSGNIAGPMETWLVHRSLSTLDMRLERMCSNAMELANMLSNNEKVKSIRYPGLPNDPSHALAKKQQQIFGFIISFELENKQKADAFLTHLNIVGEATSFGGVHSTAERRARWGTDDIAEGLIRFSVGCEHLDDLLRDISQGLDKI